MENIEDLYPLSPAQQGMLFHSLYAPNSGVYVTQICLDLRTQLDTATFMHMWEEVIQRHAILRTAFIWEGLDEPLQVVHKQVKAPCTVYDWRTHSEARRQEELDVYLLEDRERGFDLLRAPLMRVTLLQFDDEYYQLVWSFHHILLDGWSLSRILEEIFVLYKAASQGYSLSLESGRPYKDYIAWLLQQDYTETEKFWRHYLQGFSSPTPLTLGQSIHPLVAQESKQYAEDRLIISSELTTGLQALARRYQLTMNTLLETAWAVLLSWYSREQDILFGTVSSGRSEDLPGITSMVGLFINTLPLRINVSSTLSFISLAREVQASQVEVRSYEHSPLVRVHSWSEIPNTTPLFESIFVFENHPVSTTLQEEVPGLEIPQANSYLQTNYPLVLVALPGQTLELLCVFESKRFETAAIARMLEFFQTLLARIVAYPEDQIGNIAFLPEKEREQLFRYGQGANMHLSCVFAHEKFEAIAHETPDALAVRFNQEELTYRALNQKANQLAHQLIAKGVGPEIPVGICMERSLDMLVSILGVMKAGGAYVPLDPRHPQERLSFILKDAQVSLLLTHQSCRNILPSVENVELFCLDEEWEQIAYKSVENPARMIQPENLAYIIYTSGSTGRPKGVLIEHYGLGNMIEALVDTFAVRPESRVLQFYSFSFDASVHEIFMALAAGAQLHLFPQDALWTITDLTDLLREQRITIAALPPSLLKLLPDQGLPELQTLVVGGESCSADIVERWAPGRQFFNAYGPTEATVCATIADCQPDGNRPGIGHPINNTQIYILDNRLQPVPIGMPGELYIGGAGIARGYLHQAERTAAHFIPDLFSTTPGERLYKTGDQARFLPDGSIECLGRLDSQVKVRGFRIELEEIQALLHQHEVIRDAAVVLQETSANKHIVAYVVLDKTKQLSPSVPITEELKSFLQKYLPQYMLPSTFVVLEALPRTSNGKLNASALPAILESSPLEVMSEILEPLTEIGRCIATIWQEVLHVEKIGIYDNFFELGAHSLLMLQAHSKLQETLETNIPLADMFLYPTIDSFSHYLSQMLEPNNTLDADVPVDLNQEAVLDPSIVPVDKPYELVAEPTSLFLTGVTGFLGAYLLKELLEHTHATIYCLVRASHSIEGQQKIRENLEAYALWDKKLSPRIIPVIGDLAQPLLGLSPQDFHLLAGQIDSIYHCGGLVNFTYPYQALKAANVLGTQEVLRLASEIKLKSTHFISTLAVLTKDDTANELLFLENDSLDSQVRPAGGYAQSKWVAEKLMIQARSRGMPVCVYRSGLISGDSRTGASHTKDFLWAMVKGCIQLDIAPEIDMAFDLVPVDYVSKAIIHLSRQKASLGKTFHVCNAQAFLWKDLVNWIRTAGYSLQLVPYNQWHTALLDNIKRSQDNALYPFLPLFPLHVSDESLLDLEKRRYFNCQNTAAGLEDTAIVCPPVEEQLLERYFSHTIQKGGLPAKEVLTEK